jgi:hypothetical protein
MQNIRLNAMLCQSIFLSSVAAFCPCLSAEENVYRLGNAVNRQLIVENIYTYQLKDYLSPSDFPLLKAKVDLDASLPENVLLMFISAFLMRDYDYARSFWDSESLLMMGKVDALSKQDPRVRFERLAKLYEKSERIVYHKKVFYDKYVLVNFSLLNSQSKVVAEDTMALSLVGKRWFMSQNLYDNPLLSGWRSKSGRIQRPVINGSDILRK